MSLRRFALAGLLLAPALPVAAQPSPGAAPNVAPPPSAGLPVVTLASALAAARAQQPSLRQARAATDAARARVDAAAAPLYPQLNGTAAYQLTTANFVSRPGQLPATVNTAARPKPDFDLFHYWSFGLNATQLVYDF